MVAQAALKHRHMALGLGVDHQLLGALWRPLQVHRVANIQAPLPLPLAAVERRRNGRPRAAVVHGQRVHVDVWQRLVGSLRECLDGESQQAQQTTFQDFYNISVHWL